MGHLIHWPADLAVGIKRAVDEQIVGRFDHIDKSGRPFFPFVDIGDKDQRLFGRSDPVTDGF